MHSIWVPTDDGLQQYPHVFFTSHDIWDASVLNHGMTLALLEEINKEVDDSLCLMNLGSSPASGTAFGCFLGFNPYRDWGAYF